jgi:hypothetical protein
MTAHLVFLLEERSAKEMLDGLLPRLFPQPVSYRCIVFEGKQDLEKQLVRRIRGYRVPGARFIVMRDQDSGECHLIKERLSELCRQAEHPEALVRIPCREIESWYLADLKAVEDGLGLTGIAALQKQSKYRNPDALASPVLELDRITKGRYQKISGSRAIGPNLDPANVRSNSFKVFVEGVKNIANLT